uniref:Zinc/iron permease n=1 Tax=Daucus carota subsp. sativus TaxID=79200 RepID=A0A166EG64_DAUCS
MTICAYDSGRELWCRDGKAAAHLKLISIFIIFFTSVIGISLPVLFARFFQGKPAYDKAVLLIKCFAAGVILSTSLVHVLPDAFNALADCQVSSHHPWKDFPFSGLVTLVGVLMALLVDLTASSHVDSHSERDVSEYKPIGAAEMKCCGGKNKCTIRPLVAALAFHQIFEGMGLGGCIAQAGHPGTVKAPYLILAKDPNSWGHALYNGMQYFRWSWNAKIKNTIP